MEDGIGNIVYIVLTILFIIIGLIGKKKPQQAPVASKMSDDEDIASDETEGSPFRSFNDLFGDLIQGDEAVPKPMESDQYEEVDEMEYALDTPLGKIDNLEDPIDTINSKEKSQNYVEHVETIPDYIKLTEMGSANENMDLSNKENTFIAELDIEKAVVYSEILNPKYF